VEWHLGNAEISHARTSSPPAEYLRTSCLAVAKRWNLLTMIALNPKPSFAVHRGAKNFDGTHYFLTASVQD